MKKFITVALACLLMSNFAHAENKNKAPVKQTKMEVTHTLIVQYDDGTSKAFSPSSQKQSIPLKGKVAEKWVCMLMPIIEDTSWNASIVDCRLKNSENMEERPGVVLSAKCSLVEPSNDLTEVALMGDFSPEAILLDIACSSTATFQHTTL